MLCGVTEPEAGQPVLAVHAVGHAVRVQDRFDDGQSDARPLPPSGLVLAALVTLPDDGAVLLRDRLPRIDDPYQTPLPVFFHRNGNRFPVLGVIDRVIEQVAHHLADFQGVHLDVQLLAGSVKGQRELIFLGALLTAVDLALHDLA